MKESRKKELIEWLRELRQEMDTQGSTLVGQMDRFSGVPEAAEALASACESIKSASLQVEFAIDSLKNPLKRVLDTQEN